MFIAYEVASELIHSLKEPLVIVRRHDRTLADQLRRAGSSVLLNLAEGNRRVGRDRVHHFRIAAGSCAEVRAALDLATMWGYVTRESVTNVRALLDRVLALLWRLTHARR